MSVREYEIEVKRTARYFMLGKPNPELRCVWIVCHGYGQLAADFIKRFELLDDGTNLLVAPEGLSRFYLKGVAGRIGASWMTRESRRGEIYDYEAYLDAVHRQVFSVIDRRSIDLILLGFSQGAATASRWFASGKSGIDALVLWAGLLPPEILSEETPKKFQKTDLTLVYGERDEYATSERVEQQIRRLKELNIQHHVRTFNGGHEIDAGTLLALARRFGSEGVAGNEP